MPDPHDPRNGPEPQDPRVVPPPVPPTLPDLTDLASSPPTVDRAASATSRVAHQAATVPPDPCGRAPLSEPAPPPGRSRRTFLALLAGGTVAAGAGGFQLLRGGGNETAAPSGVGGVSPTATANPSTAVPTSVPATVAPQIFDPGCETAKRTLVVVELRGGNDGLATLIPFNDGHLMDARERLVPNVEDMAMIDDRYAVPLGLAGLQEQGMAFLQGVGIPDPDGSHFEMERRWWDGDMTGRERLGTGFLGRLCDELHVGNPITGLTVGTSASPIMYADKAGTVALSEPDIAWFLYNDDPWFKNLRQGMRTMSSGNGSIGSGSADRLSAARRGLGDALDFSEVLNEFREQDDDDDRPEYPSTNLTKELRLAADVLGADVGVRVVHVQFGGFDTHSDQLGSHNYLMEQLGTTLVAFRQDLERLGLSDDTLIATVSEFGRRPKQNGSGTDHGAASVAMLCGPVVNGLHGEAPSLRSLDADDNLKATVHMDEYYATLANWMGVDQRTVLPTNPSPIDGLLLPCRQPA